MSDAGEGDCSGSGRGRGRRRNRCGGGDPSAASASTDFPEMRASSTWIGYGSDSEETVVDLNLGSRCENCSIAGILSRSEMTDALGSKLSEALKVDVDRSIAVVDKQRQVLAHDKNRIMENVRCYFNQISAVVSAVSNEVVANINDRHCKEDRRLLSVRKELLDHRNYIESSSQSDDYLRKLGNMRTHIRPREAAPLLRDDVSFLQFRPEADTKVTVDLKAKKFEFVGDLVAENQLYPRHTLTMLNYRERPSPLPKPPSQAGKNLATLRRPKMTEEDIFNDSKTSDDASVAEGEDQEDDIIECNFRSSGMETVKVVEVISPSLFYVRLARDKALNQYNAWLAKEMKDRVVMKNPQVGKFCVVEAEPTTQRFQRWAKGKILNVTNVQVELFLMDSGKTEWFLREDLFKMPCGKGFRLSRILSGHPCFAAECELDVEAINGSEWTESATEDFKRFIRNASGVRLTVCDLAGKAEHFGMKYRCKLHLTKRSEITQDPFSMSHLLQFYGHVRADNAYVPKKYCGRYQFAYDVSLFTGGSIHSGTVAKGGHPLAFFLKCRVSYSSMDKEDLTSDYLMKDESWDMWLPRIGEPCAAEHIDENGAVAYGRAIILEAYPVSESNEEPMVDCFLVDKGEVLSGHPVKGTRYLIHEARIAMPGVSAIPVGLSGIGKPSDGWSDACLSYMNRFGPCQVAFNVDKLPGNLGNVAPIGGPSKFISVTAYIQDDNRFMCLNSFMVENGWAVLSDPAGPHYRRVNYFTSKPYMARTSSRAIEYGVEEVEGVFEVDVLRFYQPNRFYLTHKNVRLERELKKLQSALNKFYGGLENISELPELEIEIPNETLEIENANPKDFVAVKLGDNWARARVIETKEDGDFVKVVLIDRGDEVTVPFGDLRDLPSNFRELNPPTYLYEVDGCSQHSDPIGYVVDFLNVESYTVYVLPTSTPYRKMLTLADYDYEGYEAKMFIRGARVIGSGPFEPAVEGEVKFYELSSVIERVEESEEVKSDREWVRAEMPQEWVQGYRVKGRVSNVAYNLTITFTPDFNEAVLTEVNKKLNRNYAESRQQLHDTFWYPSDVCAVKYRGFDNLWYRGWATQIYEDKEEAVVLQVDYGTDVVCKFEDMRKDVEDVIDVPVLTYTVILKNFSYHENADVVTRWLHNQLENKEVEIEILDVPNPNPTFAHCQVNLRLNGIDIRQLMQGNNLGRINGD